MYLKWILSSFRQNKLSSTWFHLHPRAWKPVIPWIGRSRNWTPGVKTFCTFILQNSWKIETDINPENGKKRVNDGILSFSSYLSDPPCDMLSTHHLQFDFQCNITVYSNHHLPLYVVIHQSHFSKAFEAEKTLSPRNWFFLFHSCQNWSFFTIWWKDRLPTSGVRFRTSDWLEIYL